MDVTLITLKMLVQAVRLQKPEEIAKAMDCAAAVLSAGAGERYESSTQKGLFFWAEPNDIDGGKTFCVISQSDGYPATEAFDDWFARLADADQVAQKLAKGEL